jgi:hypothetical protein
LWHLAICEHFWSYVWNNWFWVKHTMSTRFWHKKRVWHHGRPELNCGPWAVDRVYKFSIMKINPIFRKIPRILHPGPWTPHIFCSSPSFEWKIYSSHHFTSTPLSFYTKALHTFYISKYVLEPFKISIFAFEFLLSISFQS